MLYCENYPLTDFIHVHNKTIKHISDVKQQSIPKKVNKLTFIIAYGYGTSHLPKQKLQRCPRRSIVGIQIKGFSDRINTADDKSCLAVSIYKKGFQTETGE